MPADLLAAIPSRLGLLVGALLLDAALGEPGWLWRRVPHPVVLMGWMIDYLDRRWNTAAAAPSARKGAGIAAILALAAAMAALGIGLERLFASFRHGWIGTIAIAAILLAGRSLYDHVRDVLNALRSEGIEAARQAVARLVGRDTVGLDEEGVARAAIESAAENVSDGLVAPAFWFLILGLPGLLAYKLVNTADSMIGHLSERHRDFGWAAARLDDAMNWVPARLSALLIGFGALAERVTPGTVLWAALSEAGRHASPNAGWPEAAMAAALGIRLGGPRAYDGETHHAPYFNASGRLAATGDIARALKVGLLAWCVLLGAVAFFAFTGGTR